MSVQQGESLLEILTASIYNNTQTLLGYLRHHVPTKQPVSVQCEIALATRSITRQSYTSFIALVASFRPHCTLQAQPCNKSLRSYIDIFDFTSISIIHKKTS